MRRSARISIALYARLLRLYPASTRSTFGAEMLAVFSLAVHDAAQRGTLAALWLALREVRDLPAAAIRAHRQARRSAHMSLPTQPHNESERDSWKAALAGAAPLFIFGLNTVAREALPPELWPGGSMNLVIVYLALLAGLGVGWLKGFPRWSYSYAGFILLFTWYWMDVATPGLLIFGHTFQHDELWGWRAWTAFAIMAAGAWLVTRSLRPVKEFFYGAGRDWTRLSFALHGFMPVIVWFCFDEIRRPYAAPYLALTTLALTGGALAYLRSTTTSKPTVGPADRRGGLRHRVDRRHGHLLARSAGVLDDSARQRACAGRFEDRPLVDSRAGANRSGAVGPDAPRRRTGGDDVAASGGRC